MTTPLNVRCQNIADSQFNDVNLAGASFTNINLSGSRFRDINFSDVEFTMAQLGGTVFKGIGLPPDSSLQRQRPVTFEDAALNDSVFHNVDLSNVKIVDCNLTGMTIDGILVTELLAAFRSRRTK